MPDVSINEIIVETPKEEEHGDFPRISQCCWQKPKAPVQIASILIENMDFTGTYIKRAECAGPGFINFFLETSWLYDTLKIIDREREDYGRINIGQGKKVVVEFVSANPTGPLHMGNARGGALGDCIASVLQAAGYDVTREYYVNDAGNQIEKFGISLEARYIQLLKGEDAVEFPEDGYQGEDIIDHMRDYIEQYGDKLLDADPEERRRELVNYALPINLERIKKGLEAYGVFHDVWFSEQSLYDSGEFEETINHLKSKGLLYEKDDAVVQGDGFRRWDVVIIRSNGLPTYFASDIATGTNSLSAVLTG